MKWAGLLFVLISVCACWARTRNDSRQETEYYVAAYAQHYNVPVDFVRAVVGQEWMAEMRSRAKGRRRFNATHARHSGPAERSQSLQHQ